MQTEEKKWRMLKTADDITPEIKQDIAACVEGWFLDEPMPAEDFLDKLCDHFGGSGRDDRSYDLDHYDNEAARAIMRIARRIRREANE